MAAVEVDTGALINLSRSRLLHSTRLSHLLTNLPTIHLSRTWTGLIHLHIFHLSIFALVDTPISHTPITTVSPSNCLSLFLDTIAATGVTSSFSYLGRKRIATSFVFIPSDSFVLLVLGWGGCWVE